MHREFFGTNDYYRIDVATERIKQCENVRDDTKQKLCELLTNINQYGYTKARKNWIKKYSENTFRNHIKKIEDFGINALTFDVIINDEEVKKEKIKNFISLENAIPEESRGDV